MMGHHSRSESLFYYFRLRREGDSPLCSTASRVKLIRGFSGSTKANDRIRPRLR
jgi:hypothetical protein